jgi:outer membrane protein TolC
MNPPLSLRPLAAGAVLLLAPLALLAQQPEPAKLSPESIAFFNDKPLPIDPKEDELQQVLKKRVNAALAEVRDHHERLQKGRGTLDRFLDSCRRLFEARMDLYQKPAERVPVLERYLEVAKDMEGVLEARQKAGLGTRADVERIRFGRLTIEAALLKARREADGKQP